MEELIKNRKKVGMTQFELSIESGIPISRITFAETGRIKLSKDELTKIKGAIRKRAKEISVLA
jgi:predicted transcriptional regulator